MLKFGSVSPQPGHMMVPISTPASAMLPLYPIERVAVIEDCVETAILQRAEQGMASEFCAGDGGTAEAAEEACELPRVTELFGMVVANPSDFIQRLAAGHGWRRFGGGERSRAADTDGAVATGFGAVFTEIVDESIDLAGFE